MSRIYYGCQTYTWKMNQARFAGDLPHIVSSNPKLNNCALASVCFCYNDFLWAVHK